MNNKPKIIAIVGATASGKTTYSIELAKQIDGEIISADSRLVYKGFDVTCAKPTIEEREGIPHYMLDIVEPEVDYSAGLYAQDAKKAVYKILAKGKTPIIVGGTGLYFRLLLENYNMPEAKPNYELRENLKQEETSTLYEILMRSDEEGAKTIDPNDRKKIIRAIEIVQTSGKPLSEARSIGGEGEFEVEWIGKNFPRSILYERIDKRVEIMLECGMVDETKFLLKKHGRIPNLTDTIGYREILRYLDGEMTLDEALTLLKQNSRNYAKRQLTWFRRNPLIKWDIYPEKLKK